MSEWMRNIVWVILLQCVVYVPDLYSQSNTYVSGIVRDSLSGEPLSYVSLIFEKSTVGTLTDDDGLFSLNNNEQNTKLVISLLGYESKAIIVNPDSENNVEILLCPIDVEIKEVNVRPGKERYSKRDNPAVELIKNVISNKDKNRIESQDNYQVEVYEKLSMALDDFDPNLEKNNFLKKFNFIKNYLDTSEFTGKPILTLSVRETIYDQYYKRDPKSAKKVVKAKRQEGVDKILDEGGALSANLEEIFKGINIFDNNIPILLNRFVSPLSSTLATSYYKYYLLDTLDVSGEKCVELGFVPVNSESYGFTGKLYITLDGHYSVKKALLNVSKDINLNWIDDLKIEQEFEYLSKDSAWVLKKENTYINFYIIKGTQQLYTHQYRDFDHHTFEPLANDSIFALPGSTYVLEKAINRPDTFWVNNRHIPLKEKENALKDLLIELQKVPVFNAIVKTVEVLITGHIPTKPNKDETLLDFGPMNTTFSKNELEGFRFRVGGMTTANLHPHLFASGYLAYGMNDRKLKHNAKLTYSFTPKKYHENEGPVNNLSFIHEYDVYTPGQNFLFTNKDNMFVALKVGDPITKMQYIQKSVLQYEKEWLNGFSLKGWAKHENNEATGTLRYLNYINEKMVVDIHDITTSELMLQLRFAPGERAYNSRKGKNSVFNLSKDAPIFTLSHQTGFKGVLGGDYNYNHTEISAEKRIWFSSFGHIDATVRAGKIWDQASFPLLIFPNTNQSITIQPQAFTLMRPMEFVTDQYAALYLTYYLKGWILNRIPIIKWLKMREVISLNGFYGGLTDKNNPIINPIGLLQLPEDTRPLGKAPYLEASIGLENIFKILRVDYYRRLTYLNEPNVKKGGVRIALRFSF